MQIFKPILSGNSSRGGGGGEGGAGWLKYALFLVTV